MLAAAARARTDVSLAFSLHRFTIVAAGLGLALLAAAAVFVTTELNGLGVSAACMRGWLEGGGPPVDGSLSACQKTLMRFYELDNAQAGPLLGAYLYVPIAIGLLAGVALVAREVEERTASIAWSLAVSRTRWLAGRVVPVAVALAVLLVAASVAATELERARTPLTDPSVSFDSYASRGWLVVARGLLAFAVALLVGAAMGRVLPALIAGAAIAAVLIVAITAVKTAWLPTQAVLTERTVDFSDGSLFVDQLLRRPDGTLIRSDGMYAVAVKPAGTAGDGAVILEDGSVVVTKYVPGSKYGTVEAFETAVTLGAAAALVAGTWFVVRQRRPA